MSRYRLAVAGYRHPHAIVAEGRCGTCRTRWDRVVSEEGKRPVKIEGGYPLDVCVLGDW